MKKILIEILMHISVWVLIFVNTFNYTIVDEEPISAIITVFFIIAIIAVPFYFNYYFLSDLIFIKKKYAQYFLIVSLTIIITYFILDFTSATALYTDSESFSEVISIVTNLILIIVFSNLFKGYLTWLEDQQRKTELEKEKLQSELNFLKLQINPHFLFNSLNNIYSLSYNKSDNAAPMIAKLSKILRYMLQECQESRVLLSKELELLKNFIDLNMLKIGEERRIDIYTEGITNNQKIAPLILITFLENAFKHGNVLTEKTGWINMESIVEDNNFTFKLTNSINKTNISQNDDSGIGLKNTKKQLELNYSDNYNLNISENDNEYIVSLQIEID